MKRRDVLSSLTAAGLSVWQASTTNAALAHTGRVEPPQPAPDLPLLDHLGQPRRLNAWLRGQVTVVQTMFTGCRSLCPIQGGLFADLQQRLPTMGLSRPVHMLSISIDALADSPDALRRWLERMNARQPLWSAAVPRVEDVDALLSLLQGQPPSRGSGDIHGTSVCVFDDAAMMRWRSAPLPAAEELRGVLSHLTR